MSKVSNFKLQVDNLNFSCNLSLKKKKKKERNVIFYRSNKFWTKEKDWMIKVIFTAV